MTTGFTVSFKSESAHAGFFSWLLAFSQEHSVETHERISFIRDSLTPEFSRWTVFPSSEFDQIKHAAMAFGSIIES